MSVAYLVDTDWVIHYLTGVPGVAVRLDGLMEEGVALSIISLAELYEGVFYSRDTEQSSHRLQDFLEGVTVVNLDDETCRVFGMERGRLRAAGRLIADMDLMIGATALRHGLTLLTNNRRHFEAMENLRLESI